MSSLTRPDPIFFTPSDGQPLSTFVRSQSSSSSSSVQPTGAARANAETDSRGEQSGGPNIGAIVGGVLGGVILVALVLFFIRWRYIRQRQSGTHAQTVRARMAQCKIEISAPTNFSHLESGTLATGASGKLTIQTHDLRNHTTSAMTLKNTNAADAGSIASGSSESPVEAMKNLNSGLGSQLTAMRNQRKPAPPT